MPASPQIVLTARRLRPLPAGRYELLLEIDLPPGLLGPGTEDAPRSDPPGASRPPDPPPTAEEVRRGA
jgi:hypothetical protein